MAYFTIGDTDLSKYVNELKVKNEHIYNSKTTAGGNTVVDYINSKRVIEVGFIPLTDTEMAQVLGKIDGFHMSISFRNPLTNQLEESVICIAPDNEVEYYTIQANNVLYKAFTIKFIEL